MGSTFVWKEKKKEPGKFGLYFIASKNDHRFIRHATEGEIEKTNLEVLLTDKEKRVICGKPRTCKLSGGKVVEVYDEDKKVYVPHDEFLRQQEEYKTNPIVDDTLGNKDEKKEYWTTHGKKTKEIKVDKKLDEKIIPMNTISTSNINLSTSGTSGLDILVPDVQVNVDIKKENDKKEDADPYDWYVKRILRRI